MPSSVRSLFRPRSIGLLLASLAGHYLISRARAPAGGAAEERGPEDGWSVTPLAGTLALVSTVLVGGQWLGWVTWQSKSESRAVAIALTRGNPDAAPALVARYGCGGCHAIGGAPGADGRVAAPLSGYRQRVYVAGVLRNTPDNLVRWIVDPPSFSPRTAMPVTGISEQEARDVAALLYMQ